MKGKTIVHPVYISKGEWFDEGTRVQLIDDYRKSEPPYDAGLFRGYRNGKIDEEVCTFDEFTTVSTE
jgi:hypothetical protein